MANEVGLGITMTWPLLNQQMGNAWVQLIDALRKLDDINTNFIEPRGGATGLQALTKDGSSNGTLVSEAEANAFLGAIYAGANLYDVFMDNKQVGNGSLTDAAGYNFYGDCKPAIGTGQ